MPKAARRKSSPTNAPRSEPYPAIKPGDKPTPKTTPKATTKSKKAPPKPLAEKSVNTVTKPTAKGNDSTKPASFLDVKLDGEDKDKVPIHDTCSVIRTKITALLGKDNHLPSNGIPGEFKKDGTTPKPYTKKRFVEDLGVGSTRMLDTFMKAKKIMGGAESEIYPAAYRFFEKKRVWEGKPKTAGRKKCEDEFPRGLELIDPNKVRIWVGPGENPSDFTNKYGQ